MYLRFIFFFSIEISMSYEIDFFFQWRRSPEHYTELYNRIESFNALLYNSGKEVSCLGATTLTKQVVLGGRGSLFRVLRHAWITNE